MRRPLLRMLPDASCDADCEGRRRRASRTLAQAVGCVTAVAAAATATTATATTATTATATTATTSVTLVLLRNPLERLA